MKRISLIIQPVSEDGGGGEPPAGKLVILSEPEVKASGRKKGSIDDRSGGLPRTEVEVVVPAKRAGDILKAVVETIYSGRPTGPPAHSLASFEALLEEHMEKLLAWMEGSGEARLHGRVIQLVERSLLRAVISRTRGNQVQAATILGINRNTLRGKLKEMKLSPGRPRPKDRRRAAPAKEPSSPDAARLSVRVG